MIARNAIAALVPTLSPRPDVWFKLAEKLIEEGFTFFAQEAEWVKGDIAGRICFTTDTSRDTAWLRHRDTNEQSHFTEGEPK